MNDMVLRQNILDELEFEPSLNAANIGVSVENGVVTLTGHVPTYMEKNTAADVVCRVKGVRGIAQNMEVRPVGSHRNTAIPEGVVQVQVEDGWVVLTGTVEWNYQKIAATEAVRALPGVFDVANNIHVKPHVSSFDVKRRIEDALKRNARVAASDIRVKVDDFGKVTLEGRVKVWAERSLATRAAWSAPGVKMVEDLLTVA
jgi:osmotically-inducible protein OsmY